MSLQTIENDFDKWLIYSRAANDEKLQYFLFKVLKSKVNSKDFELSIEVNENGSKTYLIKESYNPTILKLDELIFEKFKEILTNRFIDIKDQDNDDIEKTDDFSADIVQSNNKNHVDKKEISNSIKVDDKKLGKLLKKITYKNIFKHSIFYSTITLVFLQVVLLENHFRETERYFTKSQNIYIFIVVTFVYWLYIKTYNKQYIRYSRSKKIFRRTFLFFFSFMLFLYIEIRLIDLIKGMDRVKLFYSIYFIKLQAIAFFSSVLYSIFGFFISGGKMIDIKKEDKNTL